MSHEYFFDTSEGGSHVSFFSFYLSVFRPLTSLLRFLTPLVALRDRFGKMRLNLSDVANGGKMDNIRRNGSLFSRRKEVSIPIVLVNAKRFPGARLPKDSNQYESLARSSNIRYTLPSIYVKYTDRNVASLSLF